MNTIAVSIGELVILWSSVVIGLGLAAGLALSLSLCGQRCSRTALTAFAPLMLALSMLFCRFLHWDCNLEQYSSLWAALTNFRAGGLCVSGFIPAALLSAWLVRKLRLVRSGGALLDVAAPGLFVSLAFFRLSALFGDAWHSKISVEWKLFQRLPFAVASTDTAGNVDYRLATFFLSFLLLLACVPVVLGFFFRRRNAPMVSGVATEGNVARLALCLYCAIEIVLDSTRNDACVLHFMFLKDLNKYVSFVSLVMLLSAISMLCVFIYYMRSALRAAPRNKSRLLLIVGFVLGVGVAGGSEYLVQRYTTLHLPFHLTQAVGVAVMFLSVYCAYRCCRASLRRSAAGR